MTANDNDEILGANGQREIIRSLGLTRYCARCALPYSEIDNLGTWKCTELHPLALMPKIGGKFQCCYKYPTQGGCVPADHTDYYEFEISPMPIHDTVIDLVMDYQNRNWVKEKDGSWSVRRIDVVAYHEALRTRAAPCHRGPVTKPIFFTK